MIYQKNLKKKTIKKKLLNNYKRKLLKKNLITTKLYDELISLGAFNGDYYRFTHFSQACFLRGLRNNYTYYKTIESISLLSRATRFLKVCNKKKICGAYFCR